MSRRGRALGTLLTMGLVAAACQATPSPTPSAGPSVAPFLGASYPADAPADCAYGGEIAQIKAPDRLTVQFYLCYPDASFLTKLAQSNNAIQDGDWLARYGPSGGLPANANGTGPYRVTQGTPGAGDQVTLGRSAAYWGEPATTATVKVEWDADPAARLLALGTGAVDGIDRPAPSRFAGIEADSTLLLERRDELTTMYIGMTSTFAPFDSLRIRRALAQGIDRQRIVDTVFPPGSSLAGYVTPCGITLGCEGDPWYGRDLAAAKAVLADPGYPGPLGTHIYYSDTATCGLPEPSLVAQALQTQLTDELGMGADLQPMAAATFHRDLAAGLLDGLYLVELCPSSPDIASFLDDQFNDPANRQFGSVEQEITGPLTAAARTADPEARRAAYRDANNAIRDLVPLIPLAHGGSATAWKADVRGALSSPVDAEQFAAVDPGGRAQLVWMQGSAPTSFYCADAGDADSRRVCDNVFEGLYGFSPGTADPTPRLAEGCEPNRELTVWSCHLRSGVTFHDGATLDANDVVASFAAQWDFRQPMHAGRTGAFTPWLDQFGAFLNAAPASP